MDTNGESKQQHIPVLAETLTGQIDIPTDGILLDATVGYGGHSFLLGSKLGPGGTIVALDVDQNSIARAHQKLDSLNCRVELVRENFSNSKEVLAGLGIEKVDVIIADLGFCSGQLADEGRGLSFKSDQPLDMRLDDRLEVTAADVVNGLGQNELADLIYNYGQERASRKIARYIVEERQKEPIKSTERLAAIVSRALKSKGKKKWTKLHPATRTFQALRIAVNDEIASLHKLLEAIPQILKTGGYAAIISFHSLEDRPVKHSFKAGASEGVYELVNKKPFTASQEEVEANVRSRSAKLRIVKRI